MTKIFIQGHSSVRNKKLVDSFPYKFLNRCRENEYAARICGFATAHAN